MDGWMDSVRGMWYLGSMEYGYLGRYGIGWTDGLMNDDLVFPHGKVQKALRREQMMMYQLHKRAQGRSQSRDVVAVPGY
jgi:hypothetical protein